MPYGSFWRRLALRTTLLTAGIGQPILQLYGDNPAIFTSARVSGAAVVWFALVVLVAPVALVSLLDGIAFLLPGNGRRISILITDIVAALPFVLLLLRSLPGAWPVSLLLCVMLAVGLAVVIARVPSFSTWGAWMAPLAPAVLVLFLVSSQSVIWEAEARVVTLPTQATTSGTGSNAAGGVHTRPEDVSVLWLQLDEAPLWPLLGSDGSINSHRFPGFAALAQNATWYRNALGLSQTTVDAVPAMLSGRKPVTGRAPTYSNYRRNLFSLAYGHRAMDVHEIATAVCPKEACATVSVSGNDEIAGGTTPTAGTDSTTTSVATPQTETTNLSVDWNQFLRDALVVLGHKLLPTGLRDRLPPIDEGWGGFGNGAAVDAENIDAGSDTGASDATIPAATTAATTNPATDATLVESKRNTVRGWERDGAKSQVPVVRGMVSRAARSSIPTVHFAHLLLPHRPWQLTPDLRTTRFVSTDRRDATVEDRVRDEYQAFLAQYAATDSLVLEMVNDMKRSANWDRTMIIVTADHGIAFEPGESKRKDINPARTDTLEEIYRVPLFVKYPDQVGPKISDCRAQGFDLLPTVIAATGLDAGWTFDGSDLRGSCPVRPTRTVWWDKGSTTLTSGFDAARATATRFGQWVARDGDVDAIARTVGYDEWFDVGIPAQVERESSIARWTLRDESLFSNVGSDEFAAVPLQVDGNIRASTPPGDRALGLIVMDGRVVAVVPELASMRVGTNAWRSMVLPSSLTPGSHKPLLYVARGTPEAPRLSLVGPPG